MTTPRAPTPPPSHMHISIQVSSLFFLHSHHCSTSGRAVVCLCSCQQHRKRSVILGRNKGGGGGRRYKCYLENYTDMKGRLKEEEHCPHNHRTSLNCSETCVKAKCHKQNRSCRKGGLKRQVVRGLCRTRNTPKTRGALVVSQRSHRHQPCPADVLQLSQPPKPQPC